MRHTSIISLLMLLLSLLFGVAFSGCGHNGNGKIKVERRDVGSFRSIVLEQETDGTGFLFGNNNLSGMHVKLVKDSVEYASVEYDENLLHHVKTESVNDRLIVRTRQSLFSKRDIKINIHYIHLDHIDASSFAEIDFATPYHGRSLAMELTGASEVKGEVFADVLDLNVTGSSDLELSGKVRKFKGDFSGAGNCRTFGLITDTCILGVSGATDAQVHVLKYLNVSVSGAADVEYRGKPKVDQDITGAGEIRGVKGDTL